MFVDEQEAARKVAWIREILRRERDLKSRSSAGKRGHVHELGVSMPNTPLSELQIQTIHYHRERGMSFGMISEIMGISKTSAHKYGCDVQLLF